MVAFLERFFTSIVLYFVVYMFCGFVCATLVNDLGLEVVAHCFCKNGLEV